ncbi:hypothetical protein V2G26_018419 [Clonostachys chloroleuca]
MKSRIKNMASHSNLASPSPRTEARQEHRQEQNPDLKPGPTNPQSPIDTAFRVTEANEETLQSTRVVSLASSCPQPSLAGDGPSSLRFRHRYFLPRGPFAHVQRFSPLL